MLGLLLAGAVSLVIGILAIGFGIPVKEFSFGNTLILAGVLGSCTGAVLIAAALILRELKTLSLALVANNPPDEHHPRDRDPVASVAVDAEAGIAANEYLQDKGHRQDGASDPSQAPWQTELTARNRPYDHGDIAASEPVSKKRRNLLFTSTRRDRQTGTEESAEDKQLAESEAHADSPASFDDAWPASGRTDAGSKRGAAGSPNGAGAFPPPAPPPVRRPSEAPPITILKSGVVDGMAYSLYSDGSIEAQMSEGMVRFTSIDELRHHLDHRG